jgi:hypothetical protein
MRPDGRVAGKNDQNFERNFRAWLTYYFYSEVEGNLKINSSGGTENKGRILTFPFF